MPYQEVMHKFKEGKLHSGSKHGPKVKSRKQAVAIMLSEKRKGVKYAAHGSGPFSEKETRQGYKVCYSSEVLKRMEQADDPLYAEGMKNYMDMEKY